MPYHITYHIVPWTLLLLPDSYSFTQLLTALEKYIRSAIHVHAGVDITLSFTLLQEQMYNPHPGRQISPANYLISLFRFNFRCLLVFLFSSLRLPGLSEMRAINSTRTNGSKAYLALRTIRSEQDDKVHRIK